MTQPTRGLGMVVYMPFPASASARAMYSRSVCVCSVIATRPDLGPASDPAVERVAKGWSRALSTRALGHGSGHLDLLQRVAEIGNVLERAVDRGEADVADLVELVEFLHHHFADQPGTYFTLAEREHLLHDAVDRRVDVIRGDRPLVQRALEPHADLCGIEVRAVAVGLDHLRQAQLHGLVGREALLAVHAAPAPANRIAGLGHPRIDDLGVGAAAEGTLHVLDS